MNIKELKRLAGVNEPKEELTSTSENLSIIGTKKSQYQKKQNIKENIMSVLVPTNGLNCGLLDPN